jgi:hypothetical protein
VVVTSTRLQWSRRPAIATGVTSRRYCSRFRQSSRHRDRLSDNRTSTLQPWWAQVEISDTKGLRLPAQIFYASPTQLNLLLPDGISPGEATALVRTTVTSGAWPRFKSSMQPPASSPPTATAQALPTGSSSMSTRVDRSARLERPSSIQGSESIRQPRSILCARTSRFILFSSLLGSDFAARRRRLVSKLAMFSCQQIYAGQPGQLCWSRSDLTYSSADSSRPW